MNATEDGVGPRICRVQTHRAPQIGQCLRELPGVVLCPTTAPVRFSVRGIRPNGTVKIANGRLMFAEFQVYLPSVEPGVGMIRFQFQRFIEVGQGLGLAPALSMHRSATSIGVRQTRFDHQSVTEIRNRAIVASPLRVHFTALKESIRRYGIEKRFWLQFRVCFASSGSRPIAKSRPLMPLLKPMFLIIPLFHRKGLRRSSASGRAIRLVPQ